MVRSVLAVLAGIAVLTATSFAIEALANPPLMWMFPRALPDGDALKNSLPASSFMFLYTALCVASGGYVTAWVAHRSPVRHAVVLGAIQVALTVWAMESFSNQAPLRNWIVGMALTLPAAWLGGAIRAKRKGAAGA